jgi:hypothetical protein
MNALRTLVAYASVGLCLGLIASLLAAKWTWLEITPAAAFDTGLLMLGGAVAGLVWGLFVAFADEQPPAWLAAIPILALVAAFGLLGFDVSAVLAVPGILLREAIGQPALSAALSTTLLGVAMVPALVLPLLPRSVSMRPTSDASGWTA